MRELKNCGLGIAELQVQMGKRPGEEQQETKDEAATLPWDRDGEANCMQIRGDASTDMCVRIAHIYTSGL